MGQRYGESLICLPKHVECHEKDKTCQRLQKEIDQEVQKRDIYPSFPHKKTRIAAFASKHVILIYTILEAMTFIP